VPEPPAGAADVFGAQVGLAERYALLLETAGVERGLIGPREGPRLWVRHLLNSAVLAEWVPSGARVVDIGSGAGLPGIPLLLARPDITVTLCEPMLRRVAFLELVRDELGLSLEVLRMRAEELRPDGYDIVTARAVAPLTRLLTLAQPALAPSGALLALKGRNARAEVEAVRAGGSASSAEVERFDREVEGEMTHVVRIRWPGRTTRRRGR